MPGEGEGGGMQTQEGERGALLLPFANPLTLLKKTRKLQTQEKQQLRGTRHFLLKIPDHKVKVKITKSSSFCFGAITAAESSHGNLQGCPILALPALGTEAEVTLM